MNRVRRQFVLIVVIAATVFLAAVWVRTGPRPRFASKFAELARISAAPIEFYGKVIDQDGLPLAGVTVTGGTGSSTGFMRQQTRSYKTVTGVDGTFDFSGFSGDALIIGLEKPGYNFASERNRFRYSAIDPDHKRFTPDRAKPVLFQMWKAFGAEPLVNYYGRSVNFPPDGTPAAIDLIRGAKVAEGGDLVVRVTWGPRVDPHSYAFDWSVQFDVPSGGLIESTGDVMFAAPREGYQKTLSYRIAAVERLSSFERTFYVKSREPSVYSRVAVSLQNNPMQKDVGVTLRVKLNPRPGSRNLEPSVVPRSP